MMRFVPFLVPAAIVAAIGVIFAAQAGWLDASGPEPAFLVRADPAVHGAPPQDVARKTIARAAVRMPTTAVVAESTTVGRSVGKTNGARRGAEQVALGSGGASLAMDGAADPVVPAATPQTARPDALLAAQAEASRAKQDLLEVTQASVAAQRASEAEFERQKTELLAQVAKLQAAADNGVPQAGVPAGDDPRTKSLEADLDRARQETATLRQQIAAAPPRSTQAYDEKIVAAERRASEAQSRAKDFGDQVAALQSKVAAGTIKTEKAAETARDLDAARARTKELGDKVAALESEAEASKKAAEPLTAKAEAADRLGSQLASTRQRENALLEQVASLQAEASEAAGLKAAEAAGGRKIAALQQQLEDSRLREVDASAKFAALKAAASKDASTKEASIKEALDKEALEKDARAAKTRSAAGEIESLQKQLGDSRRREQDLGTKVAALQAKDETSAKSASDDASDAAATQLRDDLAGARRGEDTLRRENGVLQRELAQTQASSKLLGEKLAALQVGLGQPVPPVPLARHGRGRMPQDANEHAMLVRQLDALKRQQMHQELMALRIEAASLNRPRRDRGPQGQGARFVTVQPSLSPEQRSAPRRRGKPSREQAATPVQPEATRAVDRTAAKQPPRDDRDGTRTIATARAFLQSGDVEGAREVLRKRGGAVATRALADTYNPLVNSQLGVFGIDSDSDKAEALYQQAARERR